MIDGQEPQPGQRNLELTDLFRKPRAREWSAIQHSPPCRVGEDKTTLTINI